MRKDKHSPLNALAKHGKSDRLVVLLHAYMSWPGRMRYLRRVVHEAMPDADIYVPKLPFNPASLADPVKLALELAEDIDILWESRKKGSGSYGSIVLAGHSLGALLARKLYVYACGEHEQAPFESGVEDRPREWAPFVERIILLAGMNRGWTLSHHMSYPRQALWSAGICYANLCHIFFNKRFLIFHIRKGAPFLTNLRLQWLAMRQAAQEMKVGNALTVQLLGSVDDMVSPDDNVDLVTGSDFIYLDVPRSNHSNIIRMDGSLAGKMRTEVFQLSLTASQEELRTAHVQPADVAPPKEQSSVTDVIFVIHGIRDLGYWTKKIAWRIRAKASAADRIYETETSSYGYFPMLPFLLPWSRRRKVEWLMDQYAEARALYPKAEFSYVGHSNGTYMLARALQEYPACRFNRVVFAGSVVRTDYNWREAVTKGQLRSILNYVATRDWVVAAFPKALQMLHLQDLGSAGHDGFAPSENTHQIEYVRGGHSAALDEANWDSIADFIVHGSAVQSKNPLYRAQRAWWTVILGRLSPLFWAILTVVLILIGRTILHADWPEMRTMMFIGYLWFLWTIVTKV